MLLPINFLDTVKIVCYFEVMTGRVDEENLKLIYETPAIVFCTTAYRAREWEMVSEAEGLYIESHFVCSDLR